ncbi:MAG: ATPase [Actinobacteria bacterium]|nr:ATPase [Actinomycetota bacterium]
MKISVSVKVSAPIDEVWSAYVTPEDIVQWNAASDDWHTTSSIVDLRLGGAFSSRMEAKDGSFGFDFEGTYTNIIRHGLIEYEFGDRKAAISFEEQTDGVLVAIEFDAETENPIEMQRDGWQSILNNFKRHVELK